MALGELFPTANPRTLRYTGAYFYLLPQKMGNPKPQNYPLPTIYFIW